MSLQVVLPLSAESDGGPVVAQLLDSVRRRGLDLRRVMSVAYVIEFGTRREDAFAAASSMHDTDWDSALYGDASGWLLRLSRRRRLTGATVSDDLRDVTQLVERCGGQVRGAAVEDLQPDDVWHEMAAQVQTASGRRGDRQTAVFVPAQRRAGAAD